MTSLGSTVHVSSDITITRPDIRFFWQSNNDGFIKNHTAVPACTPFVFELIDNTAMPANSTGPYHLLMAPIGGMPITYHLPPLELEKDRAVWIPTFPVDTAFFVAAFDSANNSGGVAGPFTIGPSSDLSCIVEAEEPRLSFSVSPDNNPCEEMEITVEGGTAPFQVTLLSVHEGLYGNSSSTSMTKQFRLTNIVAQNEDFHLFVTDSDGHHSEVLGPMISSLHSSSCRPIVTPPQISSSSGARDNIVVAIVGSVLAVLMILTGAYFWRRRTLVRLSKSEKAARSQFINETIERQNRYGGKELNALAMEGMLRPGVGDDSLPSPSSWTVSSKHSSLANYPVRTASDRFYTPGTTPVTQVNSLAHAGPMPPTSPISLNHRLSSIRPPTPVSRSPTSPIRPRTGSSRSGLADPEEFAFRF